ncbi:hypothetical protein KP509_10G003100 [Ceratopteris richardii]|uniref:RING-type domain-containing protein n=1 Tax=Ceratopteris richardii TaxID=49495 RepID=A0A8T2TYH5_CERRI|nr:hypothetical protein KP509_10G003100 [Ceratopteris richardii]
MGNKLSRRRALVDERYTRIQGLYQHKDVDPKKLRRLILNGQLAPCFPGAEDSSLELDECPICFLFYPSLNRSKCCTKGICTECFLQIKAPHSAKPTQCPFCKSSSYVVEYRGAKTIEEKGFEQAKVIEAKIRMHQKELLDEEQRMLQREENLGQHNVPDRFRRNFSNLHGFTIPVDDLQMQGSVSGRDLNMRLEMDSRLSIQPVQNGQPETVSNQSTSPESLDVLAREDAHILPNQVCRFQGSSFQRFNRGDNFDLDLEDIMVMEAIWLSIQEQSHNHENSLLPSGFHNLTNSLNDNNPSGSTVQRSFQPNVITARSSVTSGLAGAIAALAERQAISNESIPGNGQVDINEEQAAEHEQNLSHQDNEDSNRQSFVDVALSANSQCRTDSEMEPNQCAGKSHEQEVICQTENNGGQTLSNWIEVSAENGRTISSLIRGESRGSMSDLLLDHSSEAVEVGTSFSSSVPSASELPWEGSDFLPAQNAESVDETTGMGQSIVMLPDTYEEQMMLAMALSLAEAQAQAR